MKGTVLVSGAAGAIGTAVLRALAGSECPVRALVHERPVESADESARADLAEPGDLGPALEGVAGVIHLAAVTHARNPRRYRALNVEGTRRLAIAAQRAGVERFVHVSTRALSERGGAYSVSKLEAERIVSESAMEHVIVRLPEVYGPGIREGIGEIVARARGHKMIPIVGRGDDLVCPIHVEEAAAAIAAALSSDAAPGRSYTLAGECMTTREFASLCLEAFDSGGRIVSVPVPAVAAACRVSRVLPLPFYPDQLARLRAPKLHPTEAAGADLDFHPALVRDRIREAAVGTGSA